MNFRLNIPLPRSNKAQMRADNVLPGGDDVLKGSLGRAVPPRPSRFRH